MAVPRPPIVWIGAHQNNYTRGRLLTLDDGRVITPMWEAIVWHTTAGGSSIAALDSWFNNASARASTPFGVDQRGIIHQYVSMDDTAYAHGIVKSPTARLVLENRRRDGSYLNPNTWAVGIEHLDGGNPGSVTDDQLYASAWLTAYIIDQWMSHNAPQTGFAIDRDHILGHFQIDAVSRSGCPNWPESRFSRQIERVAAIVRTGNPDALLYPDPPIPDPPIVVPPVPIIGLNPEAEKLRRALINQAAQIVTDLTNDEEADYATARGRAREIVSTIDAAGGEA